MFSVCEIRSAEFAENSRGDIIQLTNGRIEVIYSTGESEYVKFPDLTETIVVMNEGGSIAVDSNDNVYAIRWLETRDIADLNDSVKYEFVLHIFDGNYKIKHVSVLDFLDARGCPYVKIAVDKNQNLIMGSDKVYVCDNLGNLKFQFEKDGGCVRSLSISKNNDIIIVSDDERAIRTYSTEGNLKFTIKVPKGHEVDQVAFQHGSCRVIVLTYVKKDKSRFLLCYYKSGELENSVLLCTNTKHCNIEIERDQGLFKDMNSVTFIQACTLF